jgi:hypothetical protein
MSKIKKALNNETYNNVLSGLKRLFNSNSISKTNNIKTRKTLINVIYTCTAMFPLNLIFCVLLLKKALPLIELIPLALAINIILASIIYSSGFCIKLYLLAFTNSLKESIKIDNYECFDFCLEGEAILNVDLKRVVRDLSCKLSSFEKEIIKNNEFHTFDITTIKYNTILNELKSCTYSELVDCKVDLLKFINFNFNDEQSKKLINIIKEMLKSKIKNCDLLEIDSLILQTENKEVINKKILNKKIITV